MFGVPERFCGDVREHEWHGDGLTWCPGTGGEPIEHDTFAELDAAARAAGVVGHTYPTGATWPDPLRRAYAHIDGVLHTSPAVRTMTNAYPNPGRALVPSSRDRRADELADRWERGVDRQNGS